MTFSVKLAFFREKTLISVKSVIFVFGPLQLLQLTVVLFAGQQGQPNEFHADLLVVFEGRGEEDWVGKGVGE